MLITAPTATEEELKLIKEFILLPIVMDVLERDMKMLKETTLKMGDIYIRSLYKAQREAEKELYEVRKGFRNRGIKVYDQWRDKEAITAQYVVRGYHHEMSMLWSLVKTEIQLRLCRYMDVDINQEMN